MLPFETLLSPEQVSALTEEIKRNHSNICGIAVWQRENMLYERYFHGFGPEVPVHVASVTKSVISALVGIAIEQEFIKDEDVKVLDYFPEYVARGFGGQAKAVTIRHLLTMTAPYRYADWNEPLDELSMSEDWVAYALDELGADGQLGDFKYSSAGAHLLSAIISKATGKSARQFANETLFGPAGMRLIADREMKEFSFDTLFGKDLQGWAKDPQGNSTGGWGITLTVPDMVRFGMLYLKRGMWESRRVLSETWIQKSITPAAAVQGLGDYGYLWWLRNEGDIFSYAAMGDSGNVVFCVPEKELVIAVASLFDANPGDRWQLVKDYILPATNT